MFSKKNSNSIEMLKVGRTSEDKNESDKDSKKSGKIVVQQSNPITFKPIIGLLYVCLNSTFLQLTSVIIKKLLYIDPGQISLVRNISIFIGNLPVAIYHTRQILGEKEDRLFLLLRGLFGTTGAYLQMIAYSYLPLAEASIIMSTLPIMTAIMARILLKEPYRLVHCVTLIITVSGVLLSIRIPTLLQNRSSFSFTPTYIAGLLAALGNVLFYSLAAVYIRKLKNAHFSIQLLYHSVIGITVNSVLNGIFIPLVPLYCGFDQILCILFGVFAVLSTAFFVCAFKVQPAGIVAVQKSSFDILTIMVFEIIFFNRYPDLYVICSVCLVVTSLSILGFRNWILLKPQTSEFKNRLKWLL